MSRGKLKTVGNIGIVSAIFILVLSIWGAFDSTPVGVKTRLSVIIVVDLSQSTFPFPDPGDTLKKRILELNKGILERAVTAIKASGQCDKIAVMVFADHAIRLLPATSFYVNVTSNEADRIGLMLNACADWNCPEARRLKRNETDIVSAFEFVDDEIGRELDHDNNPAHPRLVILMSDGINDPSNESMVSKNNLTNKQDIDTAVRLLKSKANVQVAMLQLPAAGRMEEYALQEDWRDIIGAQYYWRPKAPEEIEAVIKRGMAHIREVNTKTVRVMTQSAFTVTPDNILKGNISVDTAKLERETDSLCIDAKLASIEWFSDSAKSWVSLSLTENEKKRFNRKAVLRSNLDDSMGYAESLPRLQEVLYDAPVKVSFKLNTDWALPYRKPTFLLVNRLSNSTLTVNESTPDTAVVSFEFRKEVNNWAWAVYVYHGCVTLFFLCMALAIWSFYWGGWHRREEITLTISDRITSEKIYPIEGDRKTRPLKGRLSYVFKKLQNAFDTTRINASLVLWPIGDRKILVEHDLITYKNSRDRGEHIRTFLTTDSTKTECTDTRSFFDLKPPSEAIYLVFNDKIPRQASASRCYICDIKVEPRKIRSHKFFDLTSRYLDYEHHEESKCRLEKFSIVPLGSAFVFTFVQFIFAPSTIGQLFSSQWIYWLAVILGIGMYFLSVTRLKKAWVALSSLSVFVLLSIVANINELIDLIQRFL